MMIVKINGKKYIKTVNPEVYKYHNGAMRVLREKTILYKLFDSKKEVYKDFTIIYHPVYTAEDKKLKFVFNSVDSVEMFDKYARGVDMNTVKKEIDKTYNATKKLLNSKEKHLVVKDIIDFIGKMIKSSISDRKDLLNYAYKHKIINLKQAVSFYKEHIQ